MTEHRWIYENLKTKTGCDSLEMATELAKLNQHLEVVQIAEAGHAVPYDQPERFFDVVQTFLHSVHT